MTHFLQHIFYKCKHGKNKKRNKNCKRSISGRYLRIEPKRIITISIAEISRHMYF